MSESLNYSLNRLIPLLTHSGRNRITVLFEDAQFWDLLLAEQKGKQQCYPYNVSST